MSKRARGKNIARESSSSAPPEDVPEPMNIDQLLLPDNLHPFLTFRSSSTQFKNNLAKIFRKNIVHPRTADWQPLNQAGIGDDIRQTLVQQFDAGGRTVKYSDWERFFSLHAPIYRELCLEFFSTYKLRPTITDVEDNKFMFCRLGGQIRYLSILDFARCLGIYTSEELRPQHFKHYLATGARIDESIPPSEIWEELSDEPYVSGGNYVSDVTDPELRVIQRFIAHTINQRKENTEKVSIADMWYLRQIKFQNYVNIPYAVAWFLQHATGRRAQSPICGGHIITLIARYCRIPLTDNLNLTLIEDPRLQVSTEMYKRAKVISVRNNTCYPYQAPPRASQSSSQQEQQEEDQQEQAYNYPAAPSMIDMMYRLEGMQIGIDNFREEYRETSRQQDYRLAALEYSSSWRDHNQELYYSNPHDYNPTPYHPLPPYGSPEASYPPPAYNRDAALEEAQRIHQQQYQESQFYEARRQEEQRGARFEDYFF